MEAAIPKSVLKKFPLQDKISTTAAPGPPQPNAREIRNREIALQHAHLIQQRKDVESSILAATETLLDFPSSRSADPAHPSISDVTQVKTLLEAFQPGDYDSLVEERNIDGKCGYVLCPRPHKLEKKKSLHQILRSGTEIHKSMKVVESEGLEKWCSKECGKRAHYLRIQLNEVPAWERTGGASILLHGEHEQNSEVRHRKEADLAAVTTGVEQLAIERGEKHNVKAPPMVEVSIHEQEVPRGENGNAFQEDDYHESSRIYNSIEGYIPRISGSRTRRRHWEDELNGEGDIIDTM